MNGECYFCHGIVSAHEEDHVHLNEHSDHEVYVHRACASGHGLVEEVGGSSEAAIRIRCPQCGDVETV